MIGRLWSISTNGNHTLFSHEDSEESSAGLTNYACPECGSQRFHLVFRTEASSHRVMLAIACGACSVRTNLPTDVRGLKEPYISDVATVEDFGASHR